MSSNNFRDYYKSMYFSGIHSTPHRYVYSGKLAGAMYAVSEIKDAIPIIHGPSGCGFHYKYICRREYLPSYNSQCTDLEEKDIIFGGEEKLRKKILEVSYKYSPSVIVVIPSVSVDMIGEEIESVVESLKGKVNCRLISIKSEKFSHVDKRNRKNIIEQRIKNWDNYGYKETIDFEGCGFVEVMKALVDEVMEEQEKSKNLINICGLAWGSSGNSIVNGMVKEFKNLGIGLNSIIPNCTIEEITKAPKAELNILTRRTQWAKEMEEKFGTGYFHINSFDLYRGLEGIEKLYLKISDILGMKKEASKILIDRRNKTIEELKPVQKYFKNFNFALFSSDYKSIPYLIEEYEKDFKVRLKYICVEMGRDSLDLDMISKETERYLIENMYKALSNVNSRAQIIINPSNSEINEMIKDVDYVIGDINKSYGFNDVKFIEDLDNVTPLDFDGLKERINNFAVRLNKISNGRNLILNKFRYMDDNSNIYGAQQMWEKMWLKRRF